MKHKENVRAEDGLGPAVWTLWHFQSMPDAWMGNDDELPHVLIGCFKSRTRAHEIRDRLSRQPGLRDWPLGFRTGREVPDRSGAWEQGFSGWWDDDGPRADPNDILALPDGAPAIAPSVVWDVWHFKLRRASDAIEPVSAKGIGLFSSLANAEAAIVHRRRQPGFCDWPEGFRIFRRRLDVAFGLDGFQGRYGWEAWRESLRGEGRGGEGRAG